VAVGDLNKGNVYCICCKDVNTCKKETCPTTLGNKGVVRCEVGTPLEGTTLHFLFEGVFIL
jgi:hypothetical protein